MFRKILLLLSGNVAISLVLFTESRAQPPGRWQANPLATISMAPNRGDPKPPLPVLVDFGERWVGVVFALADLALAVDPESDTISTIERFDAPTGPGVRVDAGVEAPCEVTPYYDPMLAKLVVAGADRPEAIARTRAALGAFVVEPLTTNLAFLATVMEHDDFQAGRYDTGWLERLAKGRL